MDTCYVIPETNAIIDLYDARDLVGVRGRVISRINVPRENRGKGYGSQLLRQVLDIADQEKIRLYLEIAPSDGLNYEQLEAWYKRYGFVWHPRYPNSIMVRYPTKIEIVDKDGVAHGYTDEDDALHGN